MGNEASQVQLSEQELRERHINRINDNMREKLGRAHDVNLKVAVRGSRRTGKTSLIRRLMGRGFSDSYAPTSIIRTCNLEWPYRTKDYACKLELWDVVDKVRGEMRER
jgi:GTPase SAR1 family protein